MKLFLLSVLFAITTFSAFTSERKEILSLGFSPEFYFEHPDNSIYKSSVTGYGASVLGSSIWGNNFTLMVPAALSFYGAATLSDGKVAVTFHNIEGTLFHSGILVGYSPLNTARDVISIGIGPSYTYLYMHITDTSIYAISFKLGVTGMISYHHFFNNNWAFNVNLLYGLDFLGGIISASSGISKGTALSGGFSDHFIPSIGFAYRF